ncbi:MAG: DUF166 domain-containing protein [Proteobacteria bacterium]|nr:DUF166 domain-containing protein [Pseudomonadota bacterium]MBU4295369.1 DUF166 domain-containing protein [Pseudomonadota bacterium]MCG2749389.1 DUF166 domain-containing protein [Desulfobulbaceae bacterium]
MDEIIVFQQDGSGEVKISGIRQYSSGLIISKVFDLPAHLPDFIDNPEQYFRGDFTADLVLSFLKHPDLLDHLARLCRKKNIPLIASGKKIEAAITPFTCCSLGRLPGLGQYGAQFGIPEYEVEVRENKICRMEVRRGASCGASWELIPRIVGLSPEMALESIAREAQYLCAADPSNFDPITGKSALHVAGKVHEKALRLALERLK